MKKAALHYVQKSVPILDEAASCDDAILLLKNNRYELTDFIYFVDKQHCLKGWIRTSRLFSLQNSDKLARVMNKKPPTVLPDTDQEIMASLVLESRISSVPVVDRDHRFLGVVPAQAIIRILRKEHLEDMNRLTGITQKITHVHETVTEPPITGVRHRLPWLLVGLVGSMGATYLMSAYEAELEKNIAISFFIPGIVYLADAIGTQSETIAVRGISLSNATFGKMLRNEFSTGILIGLIMGAIYFPFSWFVFHDLQLAYGVSLTIFIAGSIATSVAIIFPWILNAVKIDPAFGSGPMATIIQDILSILIYFLIASQLLKA